MNSLPRKENVRRNGWSSTGYVSNLTDTFWKHIRSQGRASWRCTMVVLLIMMITVNVCQAREYSNQWTVTIDGGDDVASAVARTHGYINHGRLFEDESVYVFTHNQVAKRSLRHSEEHHANLMSNRAVRSAEQQIIKRRVKRNVSSYDPSQSPIDPFWPDTWYLKPATTPSMKVTEAWKAGYTGKEVVVTILDDGIEYTHPDLAENYDALASKDINNNDDDPIPRPTYNNENRHGTRCAGEVAAVANNNYCSVGIAYDAKIGGVRMLDGAVTDAVEAQSIGLRPEHIDIYSASWGPDDDGRTVDGPAKRAKEAFVKGIEKGRGGKGSIFVWASGNGGRKSDNCNCDGYTNSIYTLSISSTTQNTDKPWYSEDCSSTLATTYSSGVSSEQQIVTTDLGKKCTKTHTGTSASAPLAAGICALALEANPNITWRDMQHIVVRTANPDGLKAKDWVTNGVGRKVSHSYGYGMMDAYAMAMLAKDWATVPTQRRCNVTIVKEGSKIQYSSSNPFIKQFSISNCAGVQPDILEHVQAVITASSSRRGDMHIYLISPKGTRSTLLDGRPLDDRSGSFSKWPFMTTHNWDEQPTGEWTLEIHTESSRTSSKGFVDYFELVVYGTLNSDWHTNGNAGVPSGIETVKRVKENRRNSSESTTIRNCKSFDEIGPTCLACEEGYFMSADHRNCVRQCPKGQYLALEKGKVPREDKSSKGIKVCKQCAVGPYCISCDGPTVSSCLECVSGFKVKEGQCILEDPNSESNKIYALTVIVCIMSVIIFIFLFLFLHYCFQKRRTGCCGQSHSETLYSYVPNNPEDGSTDKIEPKVKYANGSQWQNGVSSSLLTDSDDEIS